MLSTGVPAEYYDSAGGDDYYGYQKEQKKYGKPVLCLPSQTSNWSE